MCVEAGGAAGHSPPQDAKAKAERARACDRDPEATQAFDPTRLGTSQAALRERFGDALVAQALERPKSALERRLEKEAAGGTPGAAAPESHDSYANQARLRRAVAEHDVVFADYDLYDGVVYRIRWRLDPRFEVPVMDELVAQATACYGSPVYDQEPEWKLSEGKALLRRTGWERGERLLEVRQLHPLNGGPLFVTLTDLETVRTIVGAGGFASPDPETSPPWWAKPRAAQGELTDEQRAGLVHGFAHVLSLAEFPAAD